jgi:hypothetical protein
MGLFLVGSSSNVAMEGLINYGYLIKLRNDLPMAVVDYKMLWD